MTKTERPNFATMPLASLPYAGSALSGRPMVSETTLALVTLDISELGLTPEEKSIITRRLFDYFQDCAFRQGYEAARQSAASRIGDLLMPTVGPWEGNGE